MQDRMAQASSPSLPPRALETQRRMQEEALRERLRSVPEEKRTSVIEELEEEKRRNERGVLKRIWLGNEDEDWKQKRDQREKEALERGEGYGGLIWGQMKEVFGGAKEKLEEIEEEDRKVIEERKEGKR